MFISHHFALYIFDIVQNKLNIHYKLYIISFLKLKHVFLFRYIDRFRHGTPMSREERDRSYQQAQQDKAADFWWISDQSKISEPSDTSTPIDKNGVRTRRRTPQNGGDSTVSTRAETTRSDGNSTAAGVRLTLNVSVARLVNIVFSCDRFNVVE